MNRNSIVNFIGEEFAHGKNTHFTKGKGYKIIAGRGDGVPRNNGTLGAFIQDETTFVVSDDVGNCRVQSINSGKWEVVSESHSTYHAKPAYKSPIQLTTSLC